MQNNVSSGYETRLKDIMPKFFSSLFVFTKVIGCDSCVSPWFREEEDDPWAWTTCRTEVTIASLQMFSYVRLPELAAQVLSAQKSSAD